MPAIRFPASAVPLLPLCKGHGDNYIFKTYADLIGFLAAYGFRLVDEGHPIPLHLDCAETPNPVGIEVFENRGIYANFLMITLACDETRSAAGDEEIVAKYIEKLAQCGASQLAFYSRENFIEKVSQLFTEQTKSENNIKI